METIIVIFFALISLILGIRGRKNRNKKENVLFICCYIASFSVLILKSLGIVTIDPTTLFN